MEEKSTRLLHTQIWLRIHHLHPIFKNVPGKFPGPHLQEGYPLPHPPQSGALRRFGYPPFPSSEPSGSATARSKNIRFTFAHWQLNASMYSPQVFTWSSESNCGKCYARVNLFTLAIFVVRCL